MRQRVLVIVGLVLTVLSVGIPQCVQADEGSYWTDARRRPVYGFWVGLKTIADGDSLRASDSLFMEHAEFFGGFLEDRAKNWGPLSGMDLPLFMPDSAALILVHFERQSYLFRVRLDTNDQVEKIMLENYVPPDQLSQTTWDELGEDTLRVMVLSEFSDLAETFAQDQGAVRLIAILSPT